MFHALATCLHHSQTQQHYTDFDRDVRQTSSRLRDLAVRTLRSPNCSFVLQADDNSTISSSDLLQMVAQEYNMTADDYCANMLQPETWGGGPELMALAHALETPIHVYELVTKRFFKFKFYLKRTAQFDHTFLPSTREFVRLSNPPIEILFTDGRFPQISPRRATQPIAGDHFLALFPAEGGAEGEAGGLAAAGTAAAQGTRRLLRSSMGRLRSTKDLLLAMARRRKRSSEPNTS